MAILNVNANDVFAVPFECDPPSGAHCHRIHSGAIPLQFMETIAGKVHFFGGADYVQISERSGVRSQP
jgi:hypothetical protein